MSFFGKLFRPYAEYDVETVFAEAELEAVFEKEFAPESFWGGIRAASRENEVTFFRRRDPLVLQPVLHGGNSLRGMIFIRCAPSENASGSVLHITIAPPVALRWFPRIGLAFCIVFAVFFGCLLIWQAVIPLGMAVFVCAFHAMARAMAEREISEIRREFEGRLREFEKRYPRN